MEEVSHLICTPLTHLSFLCTVAPIIDPPSSSIVTVVVGSPLTLSCTSQGSPPDTFTFMKNGRPVTPDPSVTPVTYTNSTSVFRADYSVSSATSVHAGTYTCTVTNPIGSDSKIITVDVSGKHLPIIN